jgi:hypothetical protein
LYDVDEECLVFGVGANCYKATLKWLNGVETQKQEDTMRKCLQHFFDTKTQRRKDTKFFSKQI